MLSYLLLLPYTRAVGLSDIRKAMITFRDAVNPLSAMITGDLGKWFLVLPLYTKFILDTILYIFRQPEHLNQIDNSPFPISLMVVSTNIQG